VTGKPDGLSTLLFRESGREPEGLKVSLGSKRTPSSYHETYKGARPKAYWVAIPGVDRNLEAVQGYLNG